jgi:ADP-glucose pyrophosphorylase
MGTDSYDTDLDQRIPYGVGRESFIKNAIIDKNARIGESVRLCNLEVSRISTAIITIFEMAL